MTMLEPLGQNKIQKPIKKTHLWEEVKVRLIVQRLEDHEHDAGDATGRSFFMRKWEWG